MALNKNIQKQQQKLHQLERHLALQKIKQRKAETRRKIELGGLVVKSKINRYSKAIVLGALLTAMDDLENDEALKHLFEEKGKAAFMGFEK